jgi:hypothetical protein
MIQLRRIEGVPMPHEVPLAIVRVEGARVSVELEDDQGRHFRLEFEPYQAARVTTADCFTLPEEIDVFPQEVVEVTGSSWIDELKAVLARTDETATFMEKARHFLIPAGDEYIEVVAWEIRCEPFAGDVELST